MFAWFKRKREQPRLYAMETPYSTMFNLEDPQGALKRFKEDCPTIPVSIRPMTDAEMREKR